MIDIRRLMPHRIQYLVSSPCALAATQNRVAVGGTRIAPLQIYLAEGNGNDFDAVRWFWRRRQRDSRRDFDNRPPDNIGLRGRNFRFGWCTGWRSRSRQRQGSRRNAFAVGGANRIDRTNLIPVKRIGLQVLIDVNPLSGDCFNGDEFAMALVSAENRVFFRAGGFGPGDVDLVGGDGRRVNGCRSIRRGRFGTDGEFIACPG